jgi:hypothetical protein
VRGGAGAEGALVALCEAAVAAQGSNTAGRGPSRIALPVPRQLPARPRHLVGRDSELKLLTSFADDGRVDADVVLLDLYQADGRPALSTIAELAAQRLVLVLSASRSPAVALAAVRADAAGFLTKAAEESAYATAIRSVAACTFYLSAQLADLIQAATLPWATRPS